MCAADVHVRRLSDHEWGLLRRVRLSALADSPLAFAGDYAREAARGDDDWVALCRAGTWFVATHLGRPVGLAHSRRLERCAAEPYLESVWVAPEHRHRGIAARLLAAVVQWERAHGVRHLRIWVLDGNDVARTVWTRLGFRATGERKPLGSDPGRTEERFRLALDGWG